MSSKIIRKFSSTLMRLGRKVEGPSGTSGVHDGGYKPFKYIALLINIPIILGLAVKAYMVEVIKAENHERPPFVKYEYMRLRSKRFPWGEGNKSLFHNPHTNPLPDGYEDEGEEQEH